MKAAIRGMLAAWILLAAASACGQTYELIGAGTGQILSGSGETLLMTGEKSQAQAYVRLILKGLGCAPAEASPTSASNRGGSTTGRTRAPLCRIRKLWLDPAGDGSPSGRAFVNALAEMLAKDGRVELLGRPKGAQSIFADTGEYRMEQQAEERAQEAKRKQAEQAQQAAEAAQEAKRKQAERAAEALRFAAAGRVGALRHYIAYVVESDCEDTRVDVTYDVGTDQTEQNTEYAPWAELVTYAPGSSYSLLAQKHDGSDYGSVSAEIYSVRLTRRQVDLWSSSSGSPISPIKRYGEQLREADSDSPYGIAGVSYSPRL